MRYVRVNDGVFVSFCCVIAGLKREVRLEAKIPAIHDFKRAAEMPPFCCSNQ
jgi:hypothetical protein